MVGFGPADLGSNPSRATSYSIHIIRPRGVNITKKWPLAIAPQKRKPKIESALTPTNMSCPIPCIPPNALSTVHATKAEKLRRMAPMPATAHARPNAPTRSEKKITPAPMPVSMPVPASNSESNSDSSDPMNKPKRLMRMMEKPTMAMMSPIVHRRAAPPPTGGPYNSGSTSSAVASIFHSNSPSQWGHANSPEASSSSSISSSQCGHRISTMQILFLDERYFFPRRRPNEYASS